MSYIDLIFLDGQKETRLKFNTSLKMKEVLETYLDYIHAFKTLDPNTYVFQFGTKILNKPKNLQKTIDEIGLSSDNEIRLNRKKDRNYALFSQELKIKLSL